MVLVNLETAMIMLFSDHQFRIWSLQQLVLFHFFIHMHSPRVNPVCTTASQYFKERCLEREREMNETHITCEYYYISKEEEIDNPIINSKGIRRFSVYFSPFHFLWAP